MLALSLAVAAGCNTGDKDGPVDVIFDRDACARCSMIISDRHFVAEVRGGPRREVAKFDDIGCAITWLDAQPFASDPTTRIWVARLDDGSWVDARASRFAGGKTSPMGYGFAAVIDTEGVDFQAVQQHVRAMAQRRNK
ncbi:MAG: protein NosL [Deltaproteobacteria bacterium]|nr:protein NosL [Deltaproteobacteria bacterium]